MSEKVLVLDSNRKPLMPTRPSRAKRLLKSGRAAVYRMKPFTIILKDRQGGETQAIEAKIDPGSKTTGVAIVADCDKQGKVVVYAANLNHHGEKIKRDLSDRRSIRRNRRNRKTRYRKPRFNNRTRPKGWLPPSLKSRVDNVTNIIKKFIKYLPVKSIAVETVRFDTQLMQNPEISGTDYQQGTLQGYEVREYLLEKWQRTCAYCGVTDTKLEVEHIVPRSRGGSNRVSNLTIACTSCNQRKGNQLIDEFLSKDKVRLERIKKQAKAPLKDAAAMNSIRYAIGRALEKLKLPISFWSGAITKKNRLSQGYEKEHYIDAACVGVTGEKVTIPATLKPLTITSMGRGQRQVVRSNKYGFPRGKAGRVKRVHGFQTGDLVMLKQPKGKHAGTYVGRLASIRARGVFDIKTKDSKISANWKNFKLLQRNDGYEYT